jgi:KDO2-lipid IV(A) lauroyltransferase
MYYIVFSVIYLFSLLPFFVLYRISDLLYFLLFHLNGYRKKVVMNNLQMAFPELTDKEREKIAAVFYRTFTDALVETIKLFSISENELRRRVKMDLSVCDPLIEKGKNIHFLLGHQINWEYGNLINVLVSRVKTINVYLKLNSPIADRLMYKMRSRFGGNLVSVQNFRSEAAPLMKEQYSMGLIADQSAAVPLWGYWLNFFGRPTAFITGPDKSTRRLNPAVVFLDCVRIKRGYYRYEAIVLAENGNELEEGELTRRFRDLLEKGIKDHPGNYLWTHRRWKHEYKPEYSHNWIDTVAPPQL